MSGENGANRDKGREPAGNEADADTGNGADRTGRTADTGGKAVLLQASDVDLWRAKRRVLLLDRLCLARSTVTGLLGPNGSGKSTLLKALAGLFPPRSGRILVEGRELYPGRGCDPSVRKRVVLVHQRPVTFDRSVLGNVAYGLLRRGASRAEARRTAKKALDEAGLGDLATRPARELSGGELRRVALVRALVLEPSVLLLDEPTAEVDESSLAWLTGSIRSAASKAAVLIATHDAGFARTLADNVVELG